MKIITLPILALILNLCGSLSGALPTGSKWSTEHEYLPTSKQRVDDDGMDGLVCYYTGLCNTTLSFVDVPESKIPAYELAVTPYGHVISVRKVQPYKILTDNGSTGYLHDVPVVKDGINYSLQFHTFVNKDKSHIVQTMYFFDAEGNSVDPHKFRLNDYFKNEGKKFVQALNLPENAKKEILETFNY